MRMPSTNFSDIGKSHYLFSSYNYFNLRKVIDTDLSFLQVRISNYFEIISGFAFSSDDYTDEGVSVCRIGDISKTGELLTEQMLKLPDEYCEIYERFQIKEHDILIGMTGDGKYFKTCYVEKLDKPILLNQRVGILRLKKDIKHFEPKFLALLFQLEKVQNQIRIVAMGKTQKNVSPFDILNIKIPKINIEKQKDILKLVNPIEDNINELKLSKQRISDLINDVFSASFNINLDELKARDSSKKLDISFGSMSASNYNLRSSFRWNKLQYVQSYLYKNLDCLELLGKYILSINNGWSPESIEGGEGIPVLGQEHFRFLGRLSVTPTKATTKTKNNIGEFFIQQGDFFVSRGNTVDLVGLGSVVEEEITEEIIYPDLYIRLKLEENVINKKYLALLFNSFFGRVYFKYVSKGKNQTMVKISSSELENFYLPIPTLEKQSVMVKEVESKIADQIKIIKRIEKKQNQLKMLIEEEIRKR